MMFVYDLCLVRIRAHSSSCAAHRDDERRKGVHSGVAGCAFARRHRAGAHDERRRSLCAARHEVRTPPNRYHFALNSIEFSISQHSHGDRDFAASVQSPAGRVRNDQTAGNRRCDVHIAGIGIGRSHAIIIFSEI